MTHIDIEVIADPLCPWCFIAKRNLEQAIDLYHEQDPNASFDVIWKPFYLNPNMKASGYDKKALYAGKAQNHFPPGCDTQAATTTNGSNDAGKDVTSLRAKIGAAGAAVGIRFDLRGTTGNSRAAQALTALAAEKGTATQNRFVELLFRGHFEEGADLSSLDWLLETARRAGLEGDDVIEALGSSDLGVKVDEEVLWNRRRGIKAVPTVLVQGKYQVGGNQGPEVFVDLFGKVRDEKDMSRVARRGSGGLAKISTA